MSITTNLALPRTRPQLSATPAFVLVASIIGLALFASATPSPLYGIYQEEWHFSTPVLTLVYAVYAFGVLAALLLVGRISDEVGRRPVLIGALIGLIAASLLFVVADSVGVLFAARGLQGITTGVALGAAGAALLDLHPRGDGQHAGLVNGVVSALGIGVGGLVASVLVQYVADPTVTPFLVLIGLLAIALAGALAMPEPVTRAASMRFRPQWPSVPAEIRGPFAIAGLSVLSSWSIGGMFLALGPALARDLLDTGNHLAGGAALLALCAPAALAQVLWRSLDARRAAAIGSGVLALGMALTGLSISTGSAVFFLSATAVAGTGFGLAFLGALRSLTAVIPEARRAEVMSAFYVVCYLSISVPAIAAGLSVTELGLEPTFRIFSGFVVAIALVVTAAVLRAPRVAAATH